MKHKIFMYLFLFAVLYIVFQYMNAKKADRFYTEKVAHLEAKVDSLQQNQPISYEENGDEFSLAGNDSAREYFDERGMDFEKVSERVKGEIIDHNKAKADNDLVPFAGLEGFMRINNIKLLNHQWAIANFTDGVYWGEVLLLYEIDANNELKITPIDGLLYAQRR